MKERREKKNQRQKHTGENRKNKCNNNKLLSLSSLCFPHSPPKHTLNARSSFIFYFCSLYFFVFLQRRVVALCPRFLSRCFLFAIHMRSAHIVCVYFVFVCARCGNIQTKSHSTMNVGFVFAFSAHSPHFDLVFKCVRRFVFHVICCIILC